MRLESTPFYLYLPSARRRIAEELPDAQAGRDRPRPDRPGVLELDAPVGRRAGADSGLRRGLAGRGRAGRTPAGRRSGTTGGWAGTASSWPTCCPGSIASGCWCCATGSWSRSRPRPWTGSPGSSASPRARSRPCRRTTPGRSSSRAADRGARPGDPRRRRGRPLLRPTGLAAGQPAADPALQHGGVDKRPEAEPRAADVVAGAPATPTSPLLEEVLGESFEDWRSPTGRGSFAERV